MKILCVGDLHGRKPVLLTKDFDVIVFVGDVCDDREIAPLYKKWFRVLKSDEGSNTFGNFDNFVAKELGSLKKLDVIERRSLKKGAEIMKYLDSFGKPIFMVGGNWDLSYGRSRIKDMDKSYYNYLKWFYDSWAGDEINPKLVKGLKNVRNCMLHNVEYEGINFVGYGLSSAPESLNARSRKISKRKGKKKLGAVQIGQLRRAYDKIVGKLVKAHKGRNKKLATFFISHNIPNGTKLDVVTDKKSYAYGKHLGSTIARKFCLRFKPVICVGGHIHDHRGRDRIGKTIVVNPGYGKKAQVLVDFDVEKKRVKSVRFLR
jgi:Icc-related predicted phosphoesterase